MKIIKISYLFIIIHLRCSYNYILNDIVLINISNSNTLNELFYANTF